MTDTKRSAKPPHKLGADRHDPAVKHDKAKDAHAHRKDKDVHEDRSIRQQKLGPPHHGRK